MAKATREYPPRLVTEDFVNRLRRAVETHGEQRRIARVIGRHESTISKFLRETPRSSRIVEPICEALGWPLPPEGEDPDILALGQWARAGQELLDDGSDVLLEALDWLVKWKRMKQAELDEQEARNLADEPDDD